MKIFLSVFVPLWLIFPAQPGWDYPLMHGNVWEWCQDWYGDYPSEPVTDPQGPASGLIRVNRGGSWWWFARFCRSANRIRYMPFDHTEDIGFRLATTP
jgi:formylglycine-generating enzyme required for sulfatase activity